MTTLDEAFALAADDSGLAVVSTVRADATVQASLVNVGVLPHPATGQPALGFVTYGKVKLANLSLDPPTDLVCGCEVGLSLVVGLCA